MIQINLLPKEHIVEPPTPVARIVSAAIALLLVGLGVAWFVAKNNEKNNMQLTLNGKITKRKKLEKEKIENRYREITSLIKNLETREEAIQNIQLLRTEMSRKLFEFSDILSSGAHPVWLTKLKIAKAKDKTRLSPAERRRQRRSKKSQNVKIPTFAWTSTAECAGSQLTPAVNLFQALIDDEKYHQDIAGTGVPNYKAVELEEGYEETVGFTFNLDMNIQLKREIKKKKKRQVEKKKPAKKNNRRRRNS